jgi:hypothetical protein
MLAMTIKGGKVTACQVLSEAHIETSRHVCG